MALTCTNVTLRQRVISNGRISLYLDYYPAIRNPYTMKMSRREYLGIYIYARPKNEIERDFNNEMLSKAEAIRCIRVQAIVNEEFGFLDKHKMKADFLAYFREKAKLKYHKWDCVYQHFEKFVNGYCTFGDVTVELCQKFRQYLTLAEVKKLAATPCKIPILKQASLFSCMTGLRISDILQLTWDNIEVGPDNGYYIRICTEKTETEATLPISNEALELCGIPGSGRVFKGLTRAMTNQPLKQWISEAGIKKHITFHCFRHSYAVIQISLGTDIYTVSKMLTHKNVSTTQIYADLVNSKKRETANKISLK